MDDVVLISHCNDNDDVVVVVNIVDAGGIAIAITYGGASTWTWACENRRRMPRT